MTCVHTLVRLAALPQFPEAHPLPRTEPEGWYHLGQGQKSVPRSRSPAVNALLVSSVPTLLLWEPMSAGSCSGPQMDILSMCLPRKEEVKMPAFPGCGAGEGR